MIFPGRALWTYGHQNKPVCIDRVRDIPDIGPSVTLDLGNIGQAANREPKELSLQGPGNRLPNRRLSNARRSDETDDLALYSSAKLPDCQKLQDPVLDILQSVVVLIQDVLGIGYRIVLLGVLPPRYLRRALDMRGQIH